MTVQVRILRSGEGAMLDRVADGVFDHPVDPRLLSEFLADERHHLAVAIEQGIVVGMASGLHYVHPDKPAEFWVNEVGVATERRGEGIGKAVLRGLLEHARALGCREAWVLTDRSNTAARNLYRSAGGREGSHEAVMFGFRLET